MNNKVWTTAEALLIFKAFKSVSVSCLVPDEVGTPGKTSHMFQAFIWLLTCVDSLVSNKVWFLGKAFLIGTTHTASPQYVLFYEQWRLTGVGKFSHTYYLCRVFPYKVLWWLIRSDFLLKAFSHSRQTVSHPCAFGAWWGLYFGWSICHTHYTDTVSRLYGFTGGQADQSSDQNSCHRYHMYTIFTCMRSLMSWKG